MTEAESPKAKKEKPKLASPGQVLSFYETTGTKFLFVCGVIAGALNGLVYPMLAYIFSRSFADLGSSTSGDISRVRELAYTFLAVGTYAFVVATLQALCLEIAASRATRTFRTRWLEALLRQDSAFFDINDVSGIASSIGPNSAKMRRGLGRKLGEGIQFGITFSAGIAYAFYSSWRAALVVLAVLPFVSVSAFFVVRMNQSQSANASKAYAKAGSIAFTSVSSIKTVLSLNAVKSMIAKYSEATLEAYNASVGPLWLQGAVNGSMLGSFIFLYCVLTLYGAYLLYEEVRDVGCDPSEAVDDADFCDETGVTVFGAMLGVAFAAQGMSQMANFIETFTAARAACYPAIVAMNRRVGATEDANQSIVAKKTNEDPEAADSEQSKPIIPKYEIDSSSKEGLKPENITGNISFNNVSFFYPTRPNKLIFDGFNLNVESGKTVALVGPSGGGKSTTVALIERFYDPTAGSVKLDGVDIKDINVKYFRSQIGYVGQEPTLFATSIAGNIAYGRPGATQEDIEAAAKMANAHDFISSFPDGYNTQVGDKGAQLSGGQKQRIAIARVLIGNPKILLLDEATSALDSESELIVQEALDKLMGQKRTTIVIAHRLSTIRNADVISVIQGGKVVESGSHDELMIADTGHYRNLVEKQQAKGPAPSSGLSSRESSSTDLAGAGDGGNELETHLPQLEFKNIKFAYPARPSKLIFDDLNLTVRQGETLALVGPSGGGKSTTVALIERFYDPSEGIVEFEGIDLKLLNVAWLRDQIGYVGQEPTLFNTTIGENIAYGFEGATQKQIEEAARMANAHDFISSFPSGYNTDVGEGGAQLSGGQKQRIAIARALVKNPKILLLDEATSALDSESEQVVQEALDVLMASADRTTIVIAHRLSTIRNADRIAVIADGKVREVGTHEDLISNPKGRYRRLVEAQQRRSSTDVNEIKSSLKTDKNEDDEENVDFESEIEEEASKAYSAKRARSLAGQDTGYLLIGGIGSIFAGGVFPAWGVMFGLTVELLFTPVFPCNEEEGIPGFDSCQEYLDWTADDMRDKSFRLGVYWVVLAVGCLVGNGLAFKGFGMASERMNKRIRDSAFYSLIRQEPAFFDKRPVGAITSQLQDDAARIHTFSGEPIRTLGINLSSVLTGLVISFAYMWPFALVAIGCIPLMGFATTIEMQTFLGEDQGDDSQEGESTPGGIAVETLLNMRTVSALTMEEARQEDYRAALEKEEPNVIFKSAKSGMASGVSMLIQQYTNALQFWWGGWLLVNYPDVFTLQDFLISMFALLFSLFAFGAAAIGVSDRKECEKSAGRIFYLIDRKSSIDPLSEEGKKLN